MKKVIPCSKWTVAGLVTVAMAGGCEVGAETELAELDALAQPPVVMKKPTVDVAVEWNAVALAAVQVQSPSPLIHARSLAMTHAALFDAYNSLSHKYDPYLINVEARGLASEDAAAAQAAHDVLRALVPAAAATLDAALATTLARIPDGDKEDEGVAVGRAVAANMLASRSTDGLTIPSTYTVGSGPGVWIPTPPGFLPPALPQYGTMRPFTMAASSSFRPGPMPALASAEYATAYNELVAIGRADSATRTADQSEVAKFYQTSAPVHWTVVARAASAAQGFTAAENARFFALLYMAEADSLIACWDAKYHYSHWRPVTAITRGDTDGNDATAQDTSYAAFIVTPNHPDYPAGHGCVSSASADVIASVTGSTAVEASLTSTFAPGATRQVHDVDALLTEISNSRVWGGIHFRFSMVTGEEMGRGVAANAVANFLAHVDD